MSGQDKGLVIYQKRPLIAHVIERLQPQVDNLLINANRNREAYETFGYPVVPDATGEFLGPLAGMLAGLRAASTDIVVFAPCDSPYLSPDLAARLVEPLVDQQMPGTVARSGGRLQPVFTALRTNLAEPMEHFLEEQGRKIDAFYARHGIAEVEFEDFEAFRNINTPEDMQHS